MKKLVMIVLAFSLMCPFFSVTADSAPLALYVSTDGEENGDGTFDNPFSAIALARDYVRELKTKMAYPNGGVVINIRGGQYSLPEGLALTEEDSGEQDAPVIYRPYRNEEVKLIGGAELTMKDFEPVRDEKTIARLEPGLSNRVYQTDLRAKGIEGYGEMYVAGHASYYTNRYGISESGPPTPEIFYNGQAMPLARYPNDVYMQIGKVVDGGDAGESKFKEWSETDPSARKPLKPPTFSVNDGRINRWKQANQAWVLGYWRYDWSEQTTPVEIINTANQTITTTYPTFYRATEGQRFYIYNLIEELDVPGEWFYDKDTGILYVYPLDDKKESVLLLSFSSRPVISMREVENVQIRELSVSGTRGVGIYGNGCKNVKISYCSVGNLSSEGIILRQSTDSVIEGCRVYSTGKKGIEVSGGDRNTLTPANNIVFNNWIHDFGRLVKTYEGGILYDGVGQTIKNNLIHDGVHLAVTMNGNDNIFEYNEIHSVLKESSDMGAIYGDIGMTKRGNVIRSNIIRDCATDSAQGHVVQAIYLDNTSSGTEITGNLIYNIGGDGVFINGGRNNTVSNNVFANLRNSVTLNASGLAASWGWYGAWIDGTRHYGLKGSAPVPFTSEIYSKYPNMNDIMDGDPPYPKYNALLNNISYNVTNEYNIDALASTGTGISVEDTYEISNIVEGMSVRKDVGFQDAKGNDFAIKDYTQIKDALPQFEEIDFGRIGLVTSKLRTLLHRDAIVMVVGKPRTCTNWNRVYINDENENITPFTETENGETYIPLRFLFEAVGAIVGWEGDHATIDYNGTKIALTPDSNTVKIGELEEYIETAPIIRDGTLFVPLTSLDLLMQKEVFTTENGLIIISGMSMEGRLDEDMISDLINRL